MRKLASILVLIVSLSANAQDSVLVFTKTNGFAHPSIADGVLMFQDLAAQHDFSIVATSDASMFNAVDLPTFRAVVWLSTTGDVLDLDQQSAFEDWLAAGGGYLGIHASADCEYEWPWYGAEVLGNGAWFNSHPSIQTAMIDVENTSDLSTSHLQPSFAFTDEWYNFRANPRPAAQILLRLDETSYNPGSGAMGKDHPISWKRTSGFGRVFYTGLGHRPETYSDERFRLHALGGLLWVLGRDDEVFANGFD